MENVSKEKADKANSQDEHRDLVPSSLPVVFNTSDSRTGGSAVPRIGDAPTVTISHSDVDHNRVSKLTSQVEALSREVRRFSSLAALGPRPMMENGTWHALDVRSCSFPVPVTHTQGRVEFQKPFKSVPTVTIGIQSVDVSNVSKFRIGICATDVDEKGFTVRVNNWDAPQGSIIYYCRVAWIAIAD
ncbi:hypothetical protein F4678DRAFT_480476 [Xylaria arbuscula]|nr:hypothetical protein F4678DRAFT_480476 [Xylaria arbuscula]